MKIIKYRFQATNSVDGVTLAKKLPYTEENLAIAEAEAYNGEYTIEDDGRPEPETQPTDAERITELEEALAMLLNGVTE